MSLEKIFTSLIVTLPITALYVVPNSSLLIFDVILLLLSPILLIRLIKKNKKIKNTVYFPVLLPLIYICLQLLLFTMLYGYNSSTLFRTLRNIMYISVNLVFIKEYFNIQYAYRVLKFTSIFAGVYIIIQWFLIISSGYYLPGTLPFFDTVVDQFNNTIMNSEQLIRPRSIFSEPAAYGGYIAIFLIIDLFTDKKYHVKNYIPNIIVTIGLIITKSTTSYLLGLAIWGRWYLKKLSSKSFGKKTKYLIYSLILFPIIYIALNDTGSIQFLIERTIGNGIGELGSSLQNRIGNNNYSYYFNNMNISAVLFGRGMSDIEYFIPGNARLLYYFGFIGTLVWLIMYTLILWKTNWLQRSLVILMLVESIFGDSLFGINWLIFFPYIINFKNYKKVNTKANILNSSRISKNKWRD